MSNINNVAIIGSGPAGYTAAIYAARANLKPILVSGIQPGGQLTITTDVENYPGYENPIQGPWLMDQMQKQSLLVGTSIINSHVEKVKLDEDIKKLYLDNGKIIETKTVIICTGAQARWLGIENEQKLQGHGLSACATCDGFFFKDKIVAVIGGGNTAAEEALFLTKFASKVIIIHRRDKLRAEKILQERLIENDKIDFLWNSEVKKFHGDMELTSIEVFDNKENKNFNMDIDGVFVAIGHDPATSLFKDQIDMDDNGYILTKPDSTQTSLSGVFAAGDVKDKIYRQAVTAAGMGCMAALEVEKYLE
ncbi:MAG: thioredoxin-disulfide reductase [alpha proteobacterium HIMB59]|jgi:thioredoxin reductase (NADPH)|nr:MAG: thioredoxin-disulfide reductase [alpha proteobacterium HIMB59]|tara:strand:- start:149 stop:1069 length:921 start_codon:yes stop_codon:yes gene_type:complete